MFRPILLTLISVALLSSAPPEAAAQAVAAGPAVPRYQGLGGLARKVTTTSPEAQAYFDQGLAFLYAFNHDEAIRAFGRASELDPRCAMALWGLALANGPHINNMAVPPEREKAAFDSLAKARALEPNPVEKVLIGTLSTR